MLSDAKVIDALNKDYNNVWVLVDEVRRLKTEATDEDTRALCELLDKEYVFPVEFMFVDSNLSLIDKLNANDDSASTRPLSSAMHFLQYVTVELKKG